MQNEILKSKYYNIEDNLMGIKYPAQPSIHSEHFNLQSLLTSAQSANFKANIPITHHIALRI